MAKAQNTTQNDKLGRFASEIQEAVAQQKQAILQEIEDFSHAELGRYEDNALSDAYSMIQSRVSQLSTQSSREISQKATAMRAQLFHKREGFHQEVFEAVENKLENFTHTSDYQKWLLDKVKKTGETYPYELGQILIHKKDEALMEKIQQAFAHPCQVLISHDVGIGGFIYQNLAQGYVDDCSLAGILAEQQDWFYDHAAMEIQFH